MKRKLIVLILAAALGMTACGAVRDADNGASAQAAAESSEGSVTEAGAKEDNVGAETTDKIETGDVAALAASIDNSTIDASIYLDYAAGIEAGVYKWIKSEDGNYYTLAYIDENGEPVEAEEKEINIGANNEERREGDPGNTEKPEGVQTCALPIWDAG